MNAVVCLDSHKLAPVLAPLQLCVTGVGRVKGVSESGRLDQLGRLSAEMNEKGER